jgi:hypothetical protein
LWFVFFSAQENEQRRIDSGLPWHMSLIAKPGVICKCEGPLHPPMSAIQALTGFLLMSIALAVGAGII